MAEIQGLSKVLKESTMYDSQFSSNDKYKDKCHILFTILKRCCTHGDMLPKITKYNDEHDGYRAWRALYEHYYAKGNIKAYNTNCLTELTRV